MMLLYGVLLLCGALLSLVWAYEVNRRVPMPRWATFELIWEILLATAIGVAMVGLLLLLKYALRFEGLQSLDPVAVGGSLAAIAASVAAGLYLLRPLKALRVVEGGRDKPSASPAGKPTRRQVPRKAA